MIRRLSYSVTYGREGSRISHVRHPPLTKIVTAVFKLPVMVNKPLNLGRSASADRITLAQPSIRDDCSTPTREIMRRRRAHYYTFHACRSMESDAAGRGMSTFFLRPVARPARVAELVDWPRNGSREEVVIDDAVLPFISILCSLAEVAFIGPPSN